MTTAQVAVPARNVWHMLRYAWNIKLPEGVAGVDDGEPLQAGDLLAHLLITLLRKLMRRGLLMAYVDRVEAMTIPRGRFLISQSLGCGAALRRQVVCEQDEMTTDLLPNRAIKAAIMALLRQDDLDPTLATRLRAALLPLAEVEVGQPRDARRASRSCKDRGYRRILRLCTWIEDVRFVDPDKGDVALNTVQMSAKSLGNLFEKFLFVFVTGMQRQRPPADRLRARKRALDWSPTHPSLPRLETDICLTGPAMRLLIEVKCSQGQLASQFGAPNPGAQKLPSGHLYQLYSYLQNLASVPDAQVTEPSWKGALIYGRTQAGIDDFDANLAQYPLAVRSIDLSCPWAQVEARTRRVFNSLTGQACAPVAVVG